MSVGFDHIDLNACRARGVRVGFTPDVLTDATAELTVALALAATRRLMEGEFSSLSFVLYLTLCLTSVIVLGVEAVKSGAWGTWSPMWLCGPSLKGSTVGIVGLGRIGSAVAERLRPFGVSQILYNSRTRKTNEVERGAKLVSLDELLTQSDFVIVTCALTPDTKELFNERAFSLMKPTAVFINTSRGGIVDQQALYAALKSNRIFAAGLDVTSPEPLPTDSPLLSLPNCVVLPHIGSATIETRSMMAELCAKNIVAALNGDTMPAELKS